MSDFVRAEELEGMCLNPALQQGLWPTKGQWQAAARANDAEGEYLGGGVVTDLDTATDPETCSDNSSRARGGRLRGS